jgi:hypothetical protein
LVSIWASNAESGGQLSNTSRLALDVTGQQMDETFLRGSERFSELLARGDVAPCPDHLDRIARSVPRCGQLVLCRAPSPGSELAPWGRVLSE